ncbi:restriction endonuclease subunit S [Bacteroides fragilis]|uniref:restriction endonuclease subunit S n=2 Tax=Bacteroides TaxID=816 RepID=UPI001CE18A19|nr:restriction endonuclease subunit S [Bacteroides fragilis]MCA5611467.1 restriction endonuclease subunit S [Bacteroides fragilis]MCS2962001.1 restriction endonuclease subunit S [Bacteroides thetaiotaomicron]
MGNVPHLRFPEFTGEWESFKLTELGKFIGGGTPSSSNLSFWAGSIPWISSSDIKEDSINNISISRYITEEAIEKSTTKYCPAPVILIVSRVGVGKVALSYTSLCTSQDFCNIIEIKCHPVFLSYNLLRTMKRKSREVQGTSIKGITSDELQKIRVFIPQDKDEQNKISNILTLLDERIATQNKIIEDLKKLKSAIIHRCYSSQTKMIPLSELLKQCSDRNRSGSDLQVLSVSNKYGFIAQSDQFEDREVASDDTSNYKVVKKGMFAYNPARINIGSIALYEMDGNGIVSPMYVCFTTKSELLPSYLKYYFASQTFKHEMYKRLEGSVRLCLTFEELCNIEIHLPSIEQQKNISKYISKIENNLSLVDSIFSKYQQQRRYLLSQMFI